MLTFLSENLGTIIISVVLLAIVAGIVLKMTRDKRKGKCPGGCGDCSGCAHSSCTTSTDSCTK